MHLDKMLMVCYTGTRTKTKQTRKHQTMTNPNNISNNNESSDENNPWLAMAKEVQAEQTIDAPKPPTEPESPREPEEWGTETPPEDSTQSNLTDEELKKLDEKLENGPLPPVLGSDGPLDLYNPQTDEDLEIVRQYIYDEPPKPKDPEGLNNLVTDTHSEKPESDSLGLPGDVLY